MDPSGGVEATRAAVRRLDEAQGLLRSIDPVALSDNGLNAVARRVRAIERSAAGLVTMIGAEANRRRDAAKTDGFAGTPSRKGHCGSDRQSETEGQSGTDGRTSDGESAALGIVDDADPRNAGARGGAEEALADPSLSARQARRDVRRADIASRFPGFAAAVTAGSMTVEHLDVLYWAVEALDQPVVAMLLERSTELVGRAQRSSPRQFAKTLRNIIDTLSAVAADQRGAAQRGASEFSYWYGPDGMGHVRGALDPVRFAVLVNGIEAEVDAMVRSAERDGRKLPRRSNLTAAAHFELVTRSGGPSGEQSPLIHLLVDAKTVVDGPHETTVCETVDGEPLPLSLLERYAYDAIVRAVTLDDGLPLNVGRSRRTATAAQWAALTALYSHCAWLNCDQPVSRCQAHHLWPWEEGGPTDLANLLPLCQHHHTLVHHRNWRIRMGPTRELEVTRPDGHPHATAQPNRHTRDASSDTGGDGDGCGVDGCGVGGSDDRRGGLIHNDGQPEWEPP